MILKEIEQLNLTNLDQAKLERVSYLLYFLLGGDERLINHFLTNKNKGTDGIPIDQIQTEEGLEIVLGYIDGMSDTIGI